MAHDCVLSASVTALSTCCDVFGLVVAVEAVPIALCAPYPALLDADINRAAQETRYYLDMEEVQRQFWAHWESTGKADFKKGVAQAFMGFTKRKYGQVKHGQR